MKKERGGSYFLQTFSTPKILKKGKKQKKKKKVRGGQEKERQQKLCDEVKIL